MYMHDISVYKIAKLNTIISCITPIDIHEITVYNINRAKESEVNEMPKFPNEYPDNTDGAELLEYAAALLEEINGKEDEV